MNQPNSKRPKRSTWQEKRRSGDLAPNPALWDYLDDGRQMRTILASFYERVYADEKLAHFFDGTTIERAIDKQFSFLMEIFTGKKVYFGERPRNGHHWMVISNELFDYRERLFESCLKEFDMPEEHIKSWLKVHEVFRKQIVKDVAIPKKVRGISLPLEGHEWLVLTAGSLCDGCAQEMDTGARVAYHVRTGRTYCESCAPKQFDTESKSE